MAAKKAGKILLRILCFILAVILVFCTVEFFYYPHYKKYGKSVFNIGEQPLNNDTVSVMSSNVRCISPTDLGKKSWLYRADLIVKNVADNSPDIIGFQEVTKFHYSYLCNTLIGYDSIITYRDNTYFSESCPIFYRSDKFTLIDKGSFWLSETPEKMSKSWNAACYRICSFVILEQKSNSTRFVVFNTHLDHISDEARIGGIGVILDKIKAFGDLPSMIMGDFNSYEDSKTYQMATESFDDAKYLTADPDKSSTYQNWGKALDTPCIDYFMLSKGDFSVNTFHTVRTIFDGAYPSDHFPIYTELTIK